MENMKDDDVYFYKLTTKSPNEIYDWILNHKTISKRARAIWKRFILLYLKNDSYNLHEIFEIINRHDLGEALTGKILYDLELFFAENNQSDFK